MLHFTVWTLFVILLLIAKLKNGKSVKFIPASPKRVPFISVVIFVLKSFVSFCHKESLSQMISQYGSIVSWGFHSSPIVVISNNIEIVKSVLNSPHWNGRPKSKVSSARNYEEQNLGILLSSGEIWKGTRKCVVKTLTQLGFDNNNLVKAANEELKNFLETIDNSIVETGNKIQVKNLFALPALNVVWRIAGGKRFSKEDPVFTDLLEATNIISDYSIHKYVIFELFYPLIKILHKIFKNNSLLESMGNVKKHITNMVAEHKYLQNEGQSTFEDNLTDSFLSQMQSGKENSNDGHIYHDKNLIVVLTDLFEAGADTTSSTLEFALSYLVEHPEVEFKIRCEIKNVIGDNDPCYFTDKNFMPYTVAVISEVHRIACVSPFVFRSSDCDTNINGFHFKKGTAAFVNLYSVHHDETLWGDPENFRPERFLTKEIQILDSEIRKVLAFGAGRRACIGEKVSNTLIFTFLVGILRKYSVKKAVAKEVLGPNHNSGVTAHIKPFHVCFLPVENIVTPFTY